MKRFSLVKARVTGLPTKTVDELYRHAELALTRLPASRTHSIDEATAFEFSRLKPGEELSCSRELGEAVLVSFARALGHEVSFFYSGDVWTLDAIGIENAVDQNIEPFARKLQNAGNDRQYTLYHTHPSPGDITQLTLAVGAVRIPLSTIETNPIAPSIGDFGFLAKAGGMLDFLHLPRPSSSRVADPLGVWEYGIDRRLERKLLLRPVMSPLLDTSTIPFYSSRYENQHLKPETNPARYVRRMLNAASRERVQLSYAPIRLDCSSNI